MQKPVSPTFYQRSLRATAADRFSLVKWFKSFMESFDTALKHQSPSFRLCLEGITKRLSELCEGNGVRLSESRPAFVGS